jgi:NAD(P) transhydrogenase subunit beta
VSLVASELLGLLAAVAFVMALKMLSSPRRAHAGNYVGATGMAIAAAVTLAQSGLSNFA